jgi:hypothetical protein
VIAAGFDADPYLHDLATANSRPHFVYKQSYPGTVHREGEWRAQPLAGEVGYQRQRLGLAGVYRDRHQLV